MSDTDLKQNHKSETLSATVKLVDGVNLVCTNFTTFFGICNSKKLN